MTFHDSVTLSDLRFNDSRTLNWELDQLGLLREPMAVLQDFTTLKTINFDRIFNLTCL